MSIAYLYQDIIRQQAERAFSSLVPGLILILYFTGFSTHAQPYVKAVTDTDTYLIGDWITLHLEAGYHADSLPIQLPLLPDSFSGFEVLDRSPVDSIVRDKHIVKSQTYVLTRFDTGYFVIPPLYFTRKSGNRLDSIESDPLLVSIKGIAVDTTDIRPIKAPVEVPVSFKEMLPWIAGGLAALLIATLLIWYFFFRKKREEKPLVRIKPKRPPHEIALEKLRALEEEKLWQQGEIKAYYSAISEIIREYLEFRYDMPALESTTGEIITLLQNRLGDEPMAILKDILSTSDLVKFAKYHPLPHIHEKILKDAFRFVNITKPAPLDETQKKGVSI